VRLFDIVITNTKEIAMVQEIKQGRAKLLGGMKVK